MDEQSISQVSGSSPQPTFFEKSQLGLMAFIGGLALDAQLYATLPMFAQVDALRNDGDLKEAQLVDTFLNQVMADIPPIAEDV